MIVVLGRRRDKILLLPIVDLQALEKLVADYEAAEMPCAAAALRKRLEWHQPNSKEEEDAVGEMEAAQVNRLTAGEPMPAT